jgi:hypothetical protein
MVFHIDLRSMKTEKTFCAKCVRFDKCSYSDRHTAGPIARPQINTDCHRYEVANLTTDF